VRLGCPILKAILSFYDISSESLSRISSLKIGLKLFSNGHPSFLALSPWFKPLLKNVKLLPISTQNRG